MKNKGFFLILGCCFMNLLSAQTADYKIVATSDRQTVIEAVVAQSKNIHSLQASFIQTKKVSMLSEVLISKGTMFFMASDKLRWTYTEPDKSSFVLNGNQIKMMDAQGKVTTPNKSFSELSRLIVNMMNGDGLTDGRNFTITCYANNNSYLLKLVPVDKRLKQMFSYLTLTADKKTKIVSIVQMFDNQGNLTKIQFSNMKINQPIDVKVFAIG